MRRRAMLATGVAASLAGCTSAPPPPEGASMTLRALDDEGLTRDSALVFAPATVRLYPLTHLQRDEDGRGRLIAYVEVKDRWGDSIKALGSLQMQLYRPMRDGSLVRESVWDIDLRSEDVNVALFDPVARAYRVQLVGLPGWVEPMIDRAEARVRGTESSGLDRLVVRAVFTTVGREGEAILLRDDLIVEQ